MWIFARSGVKAESARGERERVGAHLRCVHRVDVDRQQAHDLAQQHEARRIAPRGIVEQREHDAPRAGLLVLDLIGAAPGEGAARDPALVPPHQEALERDLAQQVEIRVVAGELVAAEVGEQVADLVAVGAHLERAIAPGAVLDAVTVAAAACARAAYGPVVAEPADAAEGPALRVLHLLDPGPVLRSVGRTALTVELRVRRRGEAADERERDERSACGCHSPRATDGERVPIPVARYCAFSLKILVGVQPSSSEKRRIWKVTAPVASRIHGSRGSSNHSVTM